jgi:hypothetical protein
VDKKAVEKALVHIDTTQQTIKSRLRKPLRSVKRALGSVPKKPLTADQEITAQLQLVKTKFQLVQKDMNTYQATMRTLFDAHYAKFDNDQVMNALRNLNECMNKIHDSGKDGAWNVDEALNLLMRDKGEIMW